MTGGPSMVLIIAAPEPRGATVIASFVYEKKTGKPANLGKVLLKEIVSLGEMALSLSTKPRAEDIKVKKPELTEEENVFLRGAHYKMHHQLYAARIMMYANREGLGLRHSEQVQPISSQ